MLKTAMKLDSLTERILQAKNLSINQNNSKFGKNTYLTDLEIGWLLLVYFIDAYYYCSYVFTILCICLCYTPYTILYYTAAHYFSYSNNTTIYYAIYILIYIYRL